MLSVTELISALPLLLNGRLTVGPVKKVAINLMVHI